LESAQIRRQAVKAVIKMLVGQAAALRSLPKRGEHDEDPDGAPELSITSRALWAAAGAGFPERGGGRMRGRGHDEDEHERHQGRDHD
jgi:hypothetical protein